MDYRFTLYREWGIGPKLGWVMLNPSTADDRTDDATIRKCIGFTTRAGRTRVELFAERAARPDALHPHGGYCGLMVANLYPVRATFPTDLRGMALADRIGDLAMANYAIRELGSMCLNIVVAWGSHGAAHPDRTARVVDLLRETGAQLWCLGTTRGGQPRHPGRVGYDVPLSTWGSR